MCPLLFVCMHRVMAQTVDLMVGVGPGNSTMIPMPLSCLMPFPGPTHATSMGMRHDKGTVGAWELSAYKHAKTDLSCSAGRAVLYRGLILINF